MTEQEKERKKQREEAIDALREMRDMMMNDVNWEHMLRLVNAVTMGAFAIARLNGIDYGKAEYEGQIDSCKPIESGRISTSPKSYEFNIAQTSIDDVTVENVRLSTIEDLLALQKRLGNEELILWKQEQDKKLTLEIYDTWRE